MLIGGNKTTKTLYKKINGNCPNCNNQTLGIQVYQKYGHLFWIPFVPMYKIGMLHCSHCKLALGKKEIPAEYVEVFEKTKNDAPIPKWNFIGLFMFIVLIVLFKIFSSNADKEQKEFFKNPKVGDYYNGKLLYDDAYVVYKLVSLKKNEYKLLISNYQSESLMGLTSIKHKNSYSTDTIITDEQGFQNLINQGMLISVMRE